MIAHNGATSLVANRTIGTKVAVGFAVVLLILAVSSVFAYLAFGQVAGTMGVYSGLVARSAIFRDIDRQVTQYRGHVREYVFSNDEATATVGVKDGDTLRQLIADGLTRVTHPERRRILEDTAKQADIYASNFERYARQILSRASCNPTCSISLARRSLTRLPPCLPLGPRPRTPICNAWRPKDAC